MPPKRRTRKHIANTPELWREQRIKELEDKLECKKTRNRELKLELDITLAECNTAERQAKAYKQSKNTLMDIIQRAREEAHGSECTDVYAFMEEHFDRDLMRKCKNCGAWLNPYKPIIKCGNCKCEIK